MTWTIRKRAKTNPGQQHAPIATGDEPRLASSCEGTAGKETNFQSLTTDQTNTTTTSGHADPG
jgi:hypothetical protein